MRYIRSASDLSALSRLGHFLKGSSAQLGVLKLKASCEKLQYYGQGKDAADDQHSSISQEEAKNQIRVLLIQMRQEYDEVEHYLRNYYGEQEEDDGDEGEDEGRYGGQSE